MEKNVHFEPEGTKDIVVRLAWAQLDVFADDIEKIQVMATGDEGTVSDLRVMAKEHMLVIEQPQYGLSLNIIESHWMQVCVRIPRTWQEEIHLSTISGLLCTRGLEGSYIALDTVSGDISVSRIHAGKISLRTISGDIRAEALQAISLSVRSVSGNLVLNSTKTETLKCNSVSGEQSLHMDQEFQRMDISAVSGDVIIMAPVKRMNATLRSIGGSIRTEGVEIADDDTVPIVRVSGVSTGLKIVFVLP